MNRMELEERLIDFSVAIVGLCDLLNKEFRTRSLAKQLIRSGTSPALNFGEAVSAETRKDYIHKMQVVLKELREVNITLRIIEKLTDSRINKLPDIRKESNELLAIFISSVRTLKANNQPMKKRQI